MSSRLIADKKRSLGRDLRLANEQLVLIALAAHEAAEREKALVAALQARVDELSSLNDSLAEERNRAEQFREEYISLISHDLRAPLTIILGQTQFLQLMLEKAGLTGRSVESIVANCRRMNAMIKNLVDSARAAVGQFELSRVPTDLFKLVHDVAASLGMAEHRARIAVEAPGRPIPVLADPQQIERAIINLLTNALKYSAPDTQVVISIAQQHTEVMLAVTDQGAGIPCEELAHLFERFYRAKSRKQTEGFGLGLYITRLIVEAHGGRIWVESEVGKGSTFYLTLPLA